MRQVVLKEENFVQGIEMKNYHQLIRIFTFSDLFSKQLKHSINILILNN